jgi:2-phosphosulfolactate phosphatase
MAWTVVIDCFGERVPAYLERCAIVAVDVIRATTTAVTAVAQGRRCFPVPSLEAAWRLHERLGNALLVGEIAGEMPAGFELNNSPSAMAGRRDVERPAILLSSSGTRLLHNARDGEATYVACFRNAAAVIRRLAGRHPRIALMGAGSRGEFRKEDQICCAWIAAALIDVGYEPDDHMTAAIVDRWRDTPASACATGKSADYLRRSGQLQDLAFVLAHVNDVGSACALEGDEVVMLPDERQGERAAAER